VVLGEKHLMYLINEYVDFYNTQRPHQAKGNLPLTGGPTRAAPEVAGRSAARCG
jgi:hypothetical protein